MFGKLPGLFDRNFAIGFFIPTSVFLILTIILFDAFGLSSEYLAFDTRSSVDTIVGTTMTTLISWLLSIILLGSNRELYRVLEGYGQINPFKFFKRFEIRKFRKWDSEIRTLDDEYRRYASEGEEFPPALRNRRNHLIRAMVSRFPDGEFWLLPTSFGNTLRAFEVYSRVMYGVDSIEGWSRLLAVLPGDYQKLIDDAKANVDFWVNILFLGFVAIIEYFVLAIYFRVWVWWLSPILVALVLLVAYSRATHSVVEWGTKVKAAFDLYLPDLWEKLGFEPPESHEEKVKTWKQFSQAIIYYRPDQMPNRGKLANPSKAEEVVKTPARAWWQFWK